MMQEIVYTKSTTHIERDFLIDMTLIARQKNGQACAVLSEMHTELHENSKRRGVEVDKVLFSSPDNAKQAREILESLVRSGTCGMVIVEGFAGLMTPSFEDRIDNLAPQTNTSILLAR